MTVSKPSRRGMGQSGQALLEMALVLPVMLLLAMGLFDFGRAIYAYNTVSEAARVGARVAIVNQTTSDICQVAASRATALGLPAACATSSTQTGVFVNPPGGSGSQGCTTVNCLQSVTVTYQFQPLTPIIGRVFGPITLSSTSTVPVESLCFNNSCPRT